MKQRIYNRGKGWYISTSNFRDKNDKRAYMFVSFKNCPELMPHLNEEGFAQADIFIEEGSYDEVGGVYRGIYVYKYTEVEAKPKNDFRPSEVKDFGDEDFPW